MRKIGKVISKENNKVQLEIKRSSSCGEKCGSCSGNCDQLVKIIETEDTIDANPGEIVSLEINDSFVLKSAFLVYIFPLFMLILGVVLGSSIQNYKKIDINPELFSVIIGVLFMCISFIIIKIIDKFYFSKMSCNGEIKRIK